MGAADRGTMLKEALEHAASVLVFRCLDHTILQREIVDDALQVTWPHSHNELLQHVIRVGMPSRHPKVPSHFIQQLLRMASDSTSSKTCWTLDSLRDLVLTSRTLR